MRTVDPVKHEAKRRAILAAAAGCFARTGFDRTTVADICSAAGISSGSLFHYFPNKRAIFLGIFETDGADTAERLACASCSDDPWGAVLAELDSQIGELGDRGHAGLFVEVIAQASRDAEFAQLITAGDRALRDGLATLFRRAAECGQIDGEIDPVTAADWTCGLIDAMFTRAGSDPDFDPGAQLPTMKLILARFLRAEPR